MRILVVSDTHRNNENFFTALEKAGKVDAIIHAGDIEGSEYVFENAIDGPVYMVAGNNDFFSPLNREEEFEIEGYKVFLCHGHNYYVSMDNEILKGEARERGADIVIYGHVHRPLIEEESDLITINPGSLSYPRQEGRKPSYCIIDIDDKGDILPQIRYIV